MPAHTHTHTCSYFAFAEGSIFFTFNVGDDCALLSFVIEIVFL